MSPIFFVAVQIPILQRQSDKVEKTASDDKRPFFYPPIGEVRTQEDTYIAFTIVKVTRRKVDMVSPKHMDVGECIQTWGGGSSDTEWDQN